jgi:hypothetical protein
MVKLGWASGWKLESCAYESSGGTDIGHLNPSFISCQVWTEHAHDLPGYSRQSRPKFYKYMR